MVRPSEEHIPDTKSKGVPKSSPLKCKIIMIRIENDYLVEPKARQIRHEKRQSFFF